MRAEGPADHLRVNQKNSVRLRPHTIATLVTFTAVVRTRWFGCGLLACRGEVFALVVRLRAVQCFRSAASSSGSSTRRFMPFEWLLRGRFMPLTSVPDLVRPGRGFFYTCRAASRQAFFVRGCLRYFDRIKLNAPDRWLLGSSERHQSLSDLWLGVDDAAAWTYIE